MQGPSLLSGPGFLTKSHTALLILVSAASAVAMTPVTLAELAAGPPTVDVETAAAALGVGRSTLYEWIRLGQAPVRTISVRHRHRVVTASLLRLLGNDGGALAAPGHPAASLQVVRATPTDGAPGTA
jgi:hypothetical protein